MDLPLFGLSLTVTPIISLVGAEPINVIVIPTPESKQVQLDPWTHKRQHLSAISPGVSLAASSEISGDHDSPAPVDPSSLSEILLQADGTLETGDFVTFQDGSLYDEYLIEGRGGQSILITLESNDFDPYLILLNHRGDILAINDDITPENTDSSLLVTFPEDDMYWVVASGFKQSSRGQYRLTIWTWPKESETLPLSIDGSP
ncbi:MAG: hypothetical protein F6K09_13060 [Merismopedia sp. SIO2A8]|nr:hypothetical protein [Merismopedia sp. SIO2A8]